MSAFQQKHTNQQHSIFTNDEEKLVNEITITALAYLKTNPGQMETRVANVRATIAHMLNSTQLKITNPERWSAMYDEVLRSAVYQSVMDLESETELYTFLSSRAKSFENVGKRTKFMTYTNTILDAIKLYLDVLVNMGMSLKYIYTNWTMLKRLYFTAMPEQNKLEQILHYEKVNEVLLLLCIIIIYPTYTNVFHCENTVEKVADQVGRTCLYVASKIKHMRAQWNLEPTESMHMPKRSVEVLMEEKRRDPLGMAQLNFNEGVEELEEQFEEVFDLEHSTLALNTIKNNSARCFQPLNTDKLPVVNKDHLSSESLEDRIKIYVGSYVPVSAIIALNTTEAVSFNSTAGINSTKEPDDKVLKELGVSVTLKTKSEYILPSKEGEMLVVGPVNMDIIPGMFNKSESNEYKALVGRHIRITEEKHNNNWDHLVPNTVIAEFMNHFDVENFDKQVISFGEWLLKQPQCKARNYEEALKTIGNMNFTDARYHLREFFTKTEILVPSQDTKIANKFPRGIQGLLNNESNMYMGCFMKGVSKTIANAITPRGHAFPKFCYTNGKTPDQIGAWYHHYLNASFVKNDVKYKYIFLEDDFSAYDSTQGRGAYETECKVYELFKRRSGLDKGFLRNVTINTMYQAQTAGKGAFHKYTVPHTRKSGDQNTSVGNTIVNFLAHFAAIRKYNKDKTLWKKIHDFSMLGLGDDNLIAVAVDEKCIDAVIASFTDTILSLGLKPTILRNKYPSYCSSYFMPLEAYNGQEVHVLTPSTVRSLTKLGWSVTALPRGVTSIARVKGNMLGLPMYQYSPVMRVFHQYYTSNKEVESEEKQYRSHRVEKIVGGYNCGKRTIDWFCDLYNISNSELDDLENYLKSSVEMYEGKPFAWTHEVFRKMAKA
jgi:hypothetical protein